ncbi:MAG: tol-pal system YbgF family protein [Sandaracinaceae bacterium]
MRSGVVSRALLHLGFLVAAVLVADPAPLHAQAGSADGAREEPRLTPEDEQARAIYRLGQDAYQEARFEEALLHFREAYELSPRPELMYNIGACHERLLQWSDAIAAFERYLELAPDAANRANVEARIRVARRHADGEASDEDAEVAIASPGAEPGAAPGAEPNAGAIALAVAGGVLIAGGAIALGAGVAELDRLHALPDGMAAWMDVEGDVDRAFGLEIAGPIAIGIGASLLVAGVVWLVSGGDTDQPPDAEARF